MYKFFSRANDGNWTRDLFLTKETLYPWATPAYIPGTGFNSFYNHLNEGKKIERETGLEPATVSLEGWSSTNWATPAFNHFIGYKFVGRAGFEPTKVAQQSYSLSSLTAWVSPLNFSINSFKDLSRWRDSNPRPADYKSAALASWATSAFFHSTA